MNTSRRELCRLSAGLALLVSIGAAPAAAAPTRFSACFNGVRQGDHLPIFQTRDNSSGVIASVPDGNCDVMVLDSECNFTMCPVVFGGKRGWADGRLLSNVESGD